MHSVVAHRHALEGLPRNPVGDEAVRAQEGREVLEPERTREVADMLEKPRPVGPFDEAAVLSLGDARGDEVLGGAGLVDGGDGAVARTGQRAGALDDLAQHGLEVEARADAQQRRGEVAIAPVRSRVAGGPVVALAHGVDLLPRPRPA